MLTKHPRQGFLSKALHLTDQGLKMYGTARCPIHLDTLVCGVQDFAQKALAGVLGQHLTLT